MKFLTIRDSAVRYGSENHMLRVALGLARQGVEVHAAFPRTPGTASMIRDCEAAGVSYWAFDLNGQFGSLPRDSFISPSLQMLQLLETVIPDVVQITAGWPSEVWVPAWSCALRNVPTLAVFQCAPEVIHFDPLHVRQLAWARGCRQRWMAVSQQNLFTLRDTFETEPDEIGILYNGIEIDPNATFSPEVQTEALRREVRIELGLPGDARLLMTTARLEEAKGHADLLRIAAEIIEEFPDVWFIWAGGGQKRQALETEVDQRGLQKHIKFLGYRTDIDRLLRASDLFVFPSHLEGGCSSAIREAMLHGLPIVCSDAGGIPEVLHNGIHALLFPAKDVEAMRHQVCDALKHAAKMRCLAEKARERIGEFSSDQMVSNYLKVLGELYWAGREPGVRGHVTRYLMPVLERTLGLARRWRAPDR